jgi:dTMP kinase
MYVGVARGVKVRFGDWKPTGRATKLPPVTHLRGKFIVFDGPEGCGKSTQTQLLHRALEAQGLAVLSVRDPGTTRIGEQVRAILLNPDHREMGMRCEMLLYMAARAQMMAEVIAPALDGGKVVLCDRFVSSTLAYQLGGEGMTATEIKAVAQIAIRGRWPDLVIILDMPVEKSMERLKRAKDRIEQRPMEYHRQVYENYLALAKDDARYRVISADRDAEAVRADVWRAVSTLR